MDADIAVVGLGTMGSMAAWRLAQETNLTVLGFEQFGFGHAHGSASGESRLFRAAYHEDARFVPLLLEARKLWEELGARTSRDILLPIGALSIAQHDAPQLENVFASVAQYEMPHEILTNEELAARYPQHRLFGNEIGVLDHLGGGLRPELAVISAIEQAQQAGAELHDYTPVTEIAFDEDGVTIVTATQTYRVGQVVIASGAWTSRLVPAVHEQLEVKPLLLTWFTPHNVSEFTPDVFPVFIRDTDEFHIFGAPVLDGFSLKISVNDIFPAIADPDALERYMEPNLVSSIGAQVHELFPGVFPEPARHTVHLDAYLPGRNPIIGHFESSGRGILLAGFSGHGFKFAPLMGEIAARLATEQSTGLDLTPFDPARIFSSVGAAQQG